MITKYNYAMILLVFAVWQSFAMQPLSLKDQCVRFIIQKPDMFPDSNWKCLPMELKEHLKLHKVLYESNNDLQKAVSKAIEYDYDIVLSELKNRGANIDRKIDNRFPWPYSEGLSDRQIYFVDEALALKKYKSLKKLLDLSDEFWETSDMTVNKCPLGRAIGRNDLKGCAIIINHTIIKTNAEFFFDNWIKHWYLRSAIKQNRELILKLLIRKFCAYKFICAYKFKGIHNMFVGLPYESESGKHFTLQMLAASLGRSKLLSILIANSPKSALLMRDSKDRTILDYAIKYCNQSNDITIVKTLLDSIDSEIKQDLLNNRRVYTPLTFATNSECQKLLKSQPRESSFILFLRKIKNHSLLGIWFYKIINVIHFGAPDRI